MARTRALSGESRANASDSVSDNDCALAAAGTRTMAIAARTIHVRIEPLSWTIRRADASASAAAQAEACALHHLNRRRLCRRIRTARGVEGGRRVRGRAVDRGRA